MYKLYINGQWSGIKVRSQAERDQYTGNALCNRGVLVSFYWEFEI